MSILYAGFYLPVPTTKGTYSLVLSAVFLLSDADPGDRARSCEKRGTSQRGRAGSRACLARLWSLHSAKQHTTSGGPYSNLLGEEDMDFTSISSSIRAS